MIDLLDPITPREFYTCDAQNDFTAESNVIGANGTHLATKSDTDVLFLTIKDKNVPLFPSNLEQIFTKLIGLQIEGSGLNLISGSDLSVFTDLKYLILTSNSISVIVGDTFKDNTKLELINLSGNMISYIDGTVFTALTNLKYLYLDEILCLTGAATNSVNDATTLAALKSAVTTNCDKSENLQSLTTRFIKSYAQANENGNCDEIKENLTTVEELLTTCNGDLTNLNENIEGLNEQITNLQDEVDLCQNPVNTTCRFSLTPDYGYSCLANLISIKGNDSRVIEWDGEHLTGSSDAVVTSLILSNQNVELLPLNVTQNFPNLKNLVVKNSKLTKIEKNDFSTLKTLERLEVTGNAISTIENGAFDALTNLVHVDLSKNEISALPAKAFALLTKLTHVDIGGNKLKAVRYDMIPATNVIAHFYASGNSELKVIDVSMIWRLQKAEIIKLDGTGCAVSFDKVTDATASFMAFFQNVMNTC